MLTRRGFVTTLGAAGLLAAASLASPANAAPSIQSQSFPRTITLPTGFFPEGIAIGGPHAYLSSMANGDVYKLDLRTGKGDVLTPGPGTAAIGVALDTSGRLFVAGGETGDARVIDTASGKVIASYRLGTGTTFVNDFLLTPDAVWVTDSMSQVLYRLPLGPRGELPSQADVAKVPLGGDVVFEEGFNANGIARTPDGKALLIAQTNTGRLYRVDPATGVGTTVDLAGEDLRFADGMLLEGRTLYVVQNFLNTVAVVRLNKTGTKGQILEGRTDPRFDIPTTIARFGDHFYLPNARFGIPSPQTAEFTVVAIPQ
ncbi:SMP-30/gluconolactonase/LRE family protein [Nonomuraea turcica]|uniref:SMP-30/gluconolactonase/LRE family protein n=1 Tax=Nonomuraea sp. G32 TaxID=3067274 RepID=UPI00273ABBDF|nr:twin-arginine translocation signal domain-containing protein [Nonomuraea sp. G32]MDP4504167.1 twin-arginine translocation signal domain-containing protein [Nonomuraea sp. G32]